MKRKLISIISLCLAGAVILTGCNKVSETENENSQQISSEVDLSSLNVYNEYAVIDTPSEEYMMNNIFSIINDTIYATAIDDENFIYQLMSVDKEGNCINTVSMETDGYSIGISTDNEGNLYYIVNKSSEKDMEMGEWKIFFEKISPDGEQIFSINLKKYISAEDVYLNSVKYMPDGNIYINNEISVLVFNSEGKHLFDIDKNVGMVLDIISSKDGKILMCYYDEDFNIKMQEINCKKKSLGEEYPVNEEIMYFADGTGDFDVYVADMSSVYGINLETGEKSCILNWLESNVDVIEMDNFKVLSDGKIVVSYRDNYSDAKISIFDKVDSDIIANQKTITLAGNYLDGDIISAVVDFNKKHNEYKIDIVDYSEYATDDNFNAGKDKMNADIISGNIPDIMFLCDNNMINSLSSKNMLVDMNELIDNDDELNRSDYFENIMKTFETNGKLYVLAPSFSIETIVGNPKFISDIPENWTMSEFMDVVENIDDGVQLFEDQYMSTDYMMQNMMIYSINDFIDFENKTCNFENEDFIRLLEFSKGLNEDSEEIYNEILDDYDAYYQDAYSKYRNGDILLKFASISDVDSLYQIEALEFGDTVKFIGFPSEEGNKSYINSYVKLGISSKSENQEIAWEFMKYLLSDEFQKTQWQFPLKKSVLEEKMNKAMEPYTYKDENGEIVVDKDNIINYNGVDFKIGYMTEEHKKRYMEFISSVNCSMSYNYDISDIVLEETESYFKGDKSASEVAKIIQNRITTYINETL